ncbi:MAG: hypothetical protein KJO07_09835 [Deltaproteobacteria bacterium]|nr:hypothetical protein [Deltaproteobacteria bacterium]
MKRLALALVVLLGCGGDDEPVIEGPPRVELGSGESSFEPLVDGDEIEVVLGPQGGYHLVGSARVGGIDPGNPNDLGDSDNPTTTFRVFVGSSRFDAMASTYTQGLKSAGNAEYEMIGRFVILDILDDAELDGMMVRFEVDVLAADGAGMASDSRTLLAVPHPNNR